MRNTRLAPSYRYEPALIKKTNQNNNMIQTRVVHPGIMACVPVGTTETPAVPLSPRMITSNGTIQSRICPQTRTYHCSPRFRGWQVSCGDPEHSEGDWQPSRLFDSFSYCNRQLSSIGGFLDLTTPDPP